jgi:hypothetical protein
MSCAELRPGAAVPCLRLDDQVLIALSHVQPPLPSQARGGYRMPCAHGAYPPLIHNHRVTDPPVSEVTRTGVVDDGLSTQRPLYCVRRWAFMTGSGSITNSPDTAGPAKSNIHGSIHAHVLHASGPMWPRAHPDRSTSHKPSSAAVALISAAVCKAPLPMPGQPRDSMSQSSRAPTTRFQNGQVRHCLGRCS